MIRKVILRNIDNINIMFRIFFFFSRTETMDKWREKNLCQLLKQNIKFFIAVSDAEFFCHNILFE